VSIKLSKHSCASSAWQGRRRQLTNVSKLSDSKEMMSLGSRKPSLLDVNLARNWLFCDALRPIISSSKRLSVLRYRHCYTLEVKRHRATRSCAGDRRPRKVPKSRAREQQGTNTLAAGAEKCSRQYGPSLYTSKRLARPWAGGRVLRSGVTPLTHGKTQGLRSICEV
jgi:hypothetical protein